MTHPSESPLFIVEINDLGCVKSRNVQISQMTHL